MNIEEKNKKQFFYLAGLPRSGSTVFASILSQNPHIYVSPTSPLVGLMHAVRHMWDTASHVQAFSKEGQLERILKNIPLGLYDDIEKPVIVDKNRAWANPENRETLKKAFSIEPKVLCTVRPIPDILASFLMLIRKNPERVSFIDQELRTLGEECTDERRCALLMSEQGHVFQSWAVLKMGYEKDPKNMLFIEYDNFVTQPDVELSRVYSFLGIEPAIHDPLRIVNPVLEDDERAYNLPGMHTVRTKLSKISPHPREILGDELYARYNGGIFWR